MKPLQAISKSNAPGKAGSNSPPDKGGEKEGFSVISNAEPIIVQSNKDNPSTTADDSTNFGTAMGSYKHQPDDIAAE